MRKSILNICVVVLLITCLALPSGAAFAQSGIEGSWSGTISAQGHSASVNVTFTNGGTFSISGGGYTSSGRYSCSSSSITLTPSTPAGIGSVTMSMSLKGNHCTISGSVLGIKGSMSVSKSKLSLSEAAVELVIGESFTLTASPSNQRKLAWASSNPAIASVSDKGVVLALTGGVVTITATAPSGDSAFCVLTVQPSEKDAASGSSQELDMLLQLILSMMKNVSEGLFSGH